MASIPATLTLTEDILTAQPNFPHVSQTHTDAYNQIAMQRITSCSPSAMYSNPLLFAQVLTLLWSALHRA